MKKLLTFLTLLTLSIGVGWANTSTLTFTAACGGSGTADDGTVWTVTSDGTESSFDSNRGIHYGTNSAQVQYIQLSTSGISGTITKVVVNASTASGVTATASVTVGGNAFGGNAQSLTTTATNYTFEGSASGEIVVTVTKPSRATKALYVKSIAVTYTPSGGNPSCDVPTFSPAEGTYNSAQNITISCATNGATIYYTTDGSTPTTSSSVYSSAIPVSTTTTIKAIAAATGYENSDVASATYTIDIPSADEYELVTNVSQLSAGDKIIIANTEDNGSGYAISTTQNNNNRAATAVTIANSKINPGNSVQILTLEKEGNNWLFNTGSGYLYAASSTANYLRTETEPDANGNAEASISISSNAATVTFQGTNTRNILKYNANQGNPIFSCYETSGTVYIYKKVEATPQSNDVFIIGQANGNGWDTSVGVQMTYSNNNDNYTADIYCTGENSGTDEGYSFFLFAKSLPYDWNNTGNLYGSGGNGSYWGIGGNGESAFDSEIPLYEGSKDSFRLPAGLYTVTVDLDYSGHDYTTKSVKVTKRDVTMTISPSSGYFSDSQTVTMESNLTDIGGKIYYTTNGNDPRDQYSGRQEYTGQLTISETTNFKAVAFVGNLYSDVVEKTYTKTPAAPVISPASCTFNEPLTVTITAESGATIYYTTDGSNPTDQSTQYTGPFTVSTTTTVKAKAYVNGVYGATATETYTYSNVQPGTGDFTLVTDASQLVAGYEYIIVNQEAEAAMSTTQNTNNRGATDITLSNAGTTATPSSDTQIFTLEQNNGGWYFYTGSGYIYAASSSSNHLKTETTADANAKALITFIDDDDFDGLVSIIFQGSNSRNDLRYNSSNNPPIFSCYASSSTQKNVSLYYRATSGVQNPVFSPIAGIYNVDIDVTISCATDGATIYYTTDGSTPSATNGTQFNEDDEILVSESTTFKAIAVKGDNTSNVVTAAYTIQKSTDIATVTLTYSEPFTAGIGDFTINNVSGFSPVWSLDGNYGVKGTSYSNGTNYAAVSRLVSPIIDMTGSVQPELTFSHQINKFFTDPTTQCQVFIRETTNGTSGTWVQIPITFSDPVAAGGWTNDLADIDLTNVNGVSYADKKVQISFLYTNPTAGTGAGTWEIQNFVVADNSEYRMVNNIAEFLALDNGIKAKFKNPVTVLYDYAQRGDQEYIWVKDNSGYMQFFLVPTLNNTDATDKDKKAAFYENGDIIPAGFVVVKNYYEYGQYVQAMATESLTAGFQQAEDKGLADPEFMDFDDLHTLDITNAEDVAIWCNRYITLEKIKIASKSGKNFTFANENGTVNACVGYNKFNGDGSLLKDGTTSANVTIPAVSNTYYNVTGILQLWQNGWEFMPIEFTEWQAEEVTLRKLCADGEEGESYIISNNLLGVYASEDGTMLWVKDDDGQSIFEKDPADPYTDNFAIEHDGNTRLEQAHYDQSNWCLLMMNDENAGDFVGKIIKGGSIEGRYTDEINPTLDGVTLTSEAIYSNGSYAPNYYIPANFYGDQSCNTSQHGQPGHGDYFFMAPKPQEYAMVVWAVYNDQDKKFIMSTDPNRNTHMFEGEFTISFELNTGASSYSQLQDGYGYDFQAIIRKAVSTTGSKATGDFVVYPLDLDEGQNPTTSINDINTGNGVVKSVKYVNVAGIVSDVPFQGVNIVVTEYTDGSRTTTKMLKK